MKIVPILTAAVWMILPVVSAAQSMEQDFEWMDSLGLSHGRGLEFKKSTSKERLASIGDQSYHSDYYGFFMREDSRHVWLLGLDLVQLPIEKDTVRPVETSSLRDYIERYVTASGHELHLRRGAAPMLNTGSAFPDRSHAFLVAWMASKRGIKEDARRLYDYAHSIPATGPLSKERRPETAEPVSFRQSLIDEIGHNLLVQAIEGFSASFPGYNPIQLGRPQLRSRFVQLQTHFPNHPDAIFINRAVVLLKQMIEDDNSSKSPIAESIFFSEPDPDGEDFPESLVTRISKLPIDKQVDEWLYQMRDARGTLSADGDCWVDCQPLVDLGEAAVPALIDALDDDRFTRGVRQFPHYPHSAAKSVGSGQGARVVRIGEVAGRALRDITRWSPMKDAPPLWDATPKAIEERRKAKQRAQAEWAKKQASLIQSDKSGSGVSASKKKPVILAFEASATHLDSGMSADLRWATLGDSATVEMDPPVEGSLPLYGRVRVSPEKTTDYKLTVQNGNGIATATVRINVDYPVADP